MKKFRGVTEILCAAFIFSLSFRGKAIAADLKTLEADYTPQQFAATSSAASSTFTIIGVGGQYKIFVSSPLSNANQVGVSYHVNWSTTSSRASSGVVTYYTDTSSETFIPVATVWDVYPFIANYNPQYVFSNLNTATTLYFQAEYGKYPQK